MGIIITCFLVGVFVLMLFSEEGRGCLGAVFGLLMGVVGITLLGAAVLFALIAALAGGL
jgi:hypothetical protein